MTTTDREPVTVLGLGAMGSALAGALIDTGHATTVWNRTPGRGADLVARGAIEAQSIRDAVAATPVVVACLYDHDSIHESLDSVAADLRGRTLINLTTTTPQQARELAQWAVDHGADYLDGAIMATPPMIGSPAAVILYSGSRATFDRRRGMLDIWATSTYDGTDTGMASLIDLAMLSGMYSMFAGFLHGAAMVEADGVSAKEFAARAMPFLAAMTDAFPAIAETVDTGVYSPPEQSVQWTATVLDSIVRASSDQGVDPRPIAMVRELVRHQIETGHGSHDVYRIYESLRTETRT